MTYTSDRSESVRLGQRRSPNSAKSSTPPKGWVTEEDSLKANQELALAFQLAGLVSNGGPVCPACGANGKKVQLKVSESNNPYWKCQKCKTLGTAVKLLKEYRGYSYPDAVNTLLGRPTSGAAPQVERIKAPEIKIVASQKSVVDTEIYDAIRNSGSVEGSQAYYAAIAHIDPRFVAEAGSTYITDAKALQRSLISRFGMERLRAAGVVNEKDYFLFSDNYPVIEVHERACRDLREAWVAFLAARKAAKEAGEPLPAEPFKRPTCSRDVNDGHGHVVGMQFRPSLAHKVKIDAHKAWKKRWSGILDPETREYMEPNDAWQAVYEASPEQAGEKVPHVPAFMSLKGATQESLVGCGLRRISELPPNTKIYVVEGFKDLLAARTMNAEAYAIPGTGVLPQENVCSLLRKHIMVVSLDGDEAGAHGREVLMEHFAAMNVRAELKPNIREGLDVADILVERHVKQGCICDACNRWRAEHAS